MADVVIVGGGVVGMGLGMLLARDGRSITMLERDPEPAPGEPDTAWESWDRKGVNQFRLAHFFLARYRNILEQELPEVATSIERDGGLRFNPLSGIPDSLTGGFREGDERFELLTGRRAVVEHCGEVWPWKLCWAEPKCLREFLRWPA